MNLSEFKFHPSLSKTYENGYTYAWLDIYRSSHNNNYRAAITFYLADESTNTSAISLYRKQVESEILIAIQTGEISYDKLAIADTILYCQTHEVESVLKMFDRMLAEYAFIWIDFQNLIYVLENTKTIHFRQSYVVGSDSIEMATRQIFDSPNLAAARNILTCLIVPSSTGFEEVWIKDDIIEKKFKNSSDLYHSIKFEDKNDFWNEGEQGCWLGVFFLGR